MSETPTNTLVAPAQRYLCLTAEGTTVDADSEAVAIIQDNTTGLQWTARPLLDGHRLTHAEAVKAASEHTLLGDGWQLMSIAEWDTVKDITRFEPAVKQPFAAHWPSSGWAWTRDDVADPDGSDYAWGVLLSRGSSGILARYGRGVALACRPVPVVASPRQ